MSATGANMNIKSRMGIPCADMLSPTVVYPNDSLTSVNNAAVNNFP
jgi:hypothetical protein